VGEPEAEPRSPRFLVCDFITPPTDCSVGLLGGFPPGLGDVKLGNGSWTPRERVAQLSGQLGIRDCTELIDERHA
jgi:hypothetical protein